MDREDIIKIIPKPKNQDVIVYDLSLKELLNINVLEEYKKSFTVYNIKKENYIILDTEIKQFENFINTSYLYNKSWSEIDYIEALKREEQTYSKLYGNIKKIENNINILEQKYKAINEQIEIQRTKDINEIEKKKENIEEEIKENKQNINKLKEKINDLKIEYDRLEKQKNDIENDNELLISMQQSLDSNSYTCKYCGTVITNGNSKKRVFNLLQKNIDKNNKYLDSLKINFTNTEQSLAFYENELNSSKNILKNDIEFKKTDYNFYIKKSIKILELEAVRDDIINKINNLKSQYNSNKETKNEDFKKIKDTISKIQLSLDNLKKIRENKTAFKEKYKNLNTLKSELIELNKKLNSYKKFLEIYFKIYEQKINNYFGKDIKFKLFKFNSLELQEIFEIYYMGIEYTQLNKALKKEFDEIYLEKISYFN